MSSCSEAAAVLQTGVISGLIPLCFMVIFCLGSMLINIPQGIYLGLFRVCDLLLSYTAPADKIATPWTLSLSPVCMTKRWREGCQRLEGRKLAPSGSDYVSDERLRCHMWCALNVYLCDCGLLVYRISLYVGFCYYVELSIHNNLNNFLNTPKFKT